MTSSWHLLSTEVRCPSLTSGHHIILPADYSDIWGSQITIGCELGFIFADDLLAKNVTCLATGNWSDEETDCERKNSLQWCHNEPDGVSKYRCLNCLLNRLFKRRSKKTSKFCFTGLCKRASNAENVSIWWRHRVIIHKIFIYLLNDKWLWICML